MEAINKYSLIVRNQLAQFLFEQGFILNPDSTFILDRSDAIWRVTHSFRQRDFGGLMQVSVGVGFPTVNAFLAKAGVLNEQLVNIKDLSAMGTDLGHLKPPYRYQEWNIDLLTDAETLGQELVDNLRNYALPFFENYGTLDKCVKAWEAGDFLNRGAGCEFFLAAAYWMQGDRHRAIDYITSRTKYYHDEYQAKGKQSDYQVLQQRRKFLFFLKENANNI
jgi:hypothetical protein